MCSGKKKSLPEGWPHENERTSRGSEPSTNKEVPKQYYITLVNRKIRFRERFLCAAERKKAYLKVGPTKTREPVGEVSKEKSVRKTIADDAPKSLDAIFPGDFLTFFISASRIGNGHFVDAPIPFCDFGGNFRLESEAIGPELDALEDLAAENFVARLHIGEFQVGENVRKQREEFVGDIMPEIVDALRTAEKAGAKDYISTAIEDGFEKFVVIARIVFEVSILDEDDVAGNFRKAAAQGRTLSLILRLEKDAEVAEVDGIRDRKSTRLNSSH